MKPISQLTNHELDIEIAKERGWSVVQMRTFQLWSPSSDERWYNYATEEEAWGSKWLPTPTADANLALELLAGQECVIVSDYLSTLVTMGSTNNPCLSRIWDKPSVALRRAICEAWLQAKRGH